MTESRSRIGVRSRRVILKIRRVSNNNYRLLDTGGQGLEYRKRADLPSDAAKAADSAGGADVLIEGWLNRKARWSINRVIERL